MVTGKLVKTVCSRFEMGALALCGLPCETVPF